MARKSGEQLKEGLLLLFVVLSVSLVGLTWADGLSAPPVETPANVRGAPPVGTPLERSGDSPPITVTPREHRHTATPTPPMPATSTPTSGLDNPPTATVDPFDITQDE